MSKNTNDDLVNEVTTGDEVLIPGNEGGKAAPGVKHCAECTHRFRPTHRNHRYCSPQCKSAYNAREALRGAQLYRTMMAAHFYARENPQLDDNPYFDKAERDIQGWAIEDMQQGRAPSVKPIV